MKHRGWLDTAVLAFGILSFLSLVAFFLALTDIGRDYASPGVFVRAGQSLPEWYSPVNRTTGEWRVLQIGFVLMLVFHVLWIAKRIQDSKSNK